MDNIEMTDNFCNSHINGGGKRLLILGAGRGQVGLYKAAHEMGIHTIAGTPKGRTYPGMALADEICWMDIAKPDEALAAASALGIDGVATSCMDTGIISLGKICDALGLNGLSETAAARCNDKARMKKALTEHGVRTARYFQISTEDELRSALRELKLPVVVKATDLQGSNGVFISKTCDEALSSFEKAMNLTRRSYCIVEEFIKGKEFGAQAFVHNGNILFIMPHGDITYMGRTAIPVGHFVPFDESAENYSLIHETVINSIAALGLDNCAVNIDLILKDNEVYVIELTGRVGANGLPELVESSYGIEYWKMIAAMAVGDDPDVYFSKRRSERKAVLSKMIFETDKSGIVESVDCGSLTNDTVYDITFFKHPGDEVHKFSSANDCIGQVIVEGNSLGECMVKMDKVFSEITVSVR